MTKDEKKREIARVKSEIIKELDAYTRAEFDTETTENGDEIYGVAFTEITNSKGEDSDMQVSMDLKHGGLDFEYGKMREVFIPYSLLDLLDIARSCGWDEYCADGVDHAPRGYGFA